MRSRRRLGFSRVSFGVKASEVMGAAPAVSHNRLNGFLDLGLVRQIGERVRLTPRGWLVSNEVLACLM